MNKNPVLAFFLPFFLYLQKSFLNRSKITLFFKKENLYFFLALSVLTSITFLLCETIFFEVLYSADNLYLPLLARDFFTQGKISHWYLPPSPYLFPDFLLMVLLYQFFPFLFLPTVYGVVQSSLFFMGIYFYQWQKEKNQNLALFRMLLFSFALFVFAIVSFVFSDSPNPFVFLFCNAHHSTGFLFGFSLYLFYRNAKKDYGIFLIFVFTFLYSNDRLATILIITPLFFLTKSNEKKFALLFIPILGEILIFGLHEFFLFPSSFKTLQNYTEFKSTKQLFFLATSYLFDFSKILFYQGKIFLFVFTFGIFQWKQIPKQSKLFLVYTFFISIFVLIIVGRFTYLHPYPIRYLLPVLILILLFVISNAQGKWEWLLIFILVLIPCLALTLEFPRKPTYLSFQRAFGKTVSYDLEKPIRFWTEGKQTPVPVDKEGKAYLWITGAFGSRHTP
ncbi:hypothetical protein P3G55_02685 [Leptospira sp. 96542]|nr:hypothetical protein [Leptospira sp. 96542]